MKFEDYISLWKTKDERLIEECGMDKTQRESVNTTNWTLCVLERIGDAIQSEGLIIKPNEQYRLSILMRNAYSEKVRITRTFI